MEKVTVQSYLLDPGGEVSLDAQVERAGERFLTEHSGVHIIGYQLLPPPPRIDNSRLPPNFGRELSALYPHVQFVGVIEVGGTANNPL